MNSLNRDWKENLREFYNGLDGDYNESRENLLIEYVSELIEEAKAEERKSCLEVLPEIEEFANCEDDANFNYGWNSYRNQAISAITNQIKDK